MQRREFFRTLTRLLGLAALPPAAQASLPQRHLILICPLAGFQYHRGEYLWPRLMVGDLLRAQREPDNPYDTDAITPSPPPPAAARRWPCWPSPWPMRPATD